MAKKAVCEKTPELSPNQTNPEAIFSFSEHILGHMNPLVNTKQLKGLISDHVGEKNRDYLLNWPSYSNFP